MNLFFPMSQNNDEERHRTVFEIDEETDVYFYEQAYAYHEHLVHKENRPRLTWNPIYRDREGAEERLMVDYFDDHCRVDPMLRTNESLVTMKCHSGHTSNDIRTTPDAFDEYLQMSEHTARDCVNNDINVLDNSPLFDDIFDDKAPVAPYVVNDVVFEKGYYLADGIYPQWATFVKSFMVANDAKHAYFKKRQESARKDVERAFDVLQGRWGIIQQHARQYHVNTIRQIMYSCIIMHNMVLKDHKMAVFDWNDMYANPSRNMQRT
ncbi:ALP1-like protein isoform X1 [Tanacetum coccineum]